VRALPTVSCASYGRLWHPDDCRATGVFFSDPEASRVDLREGCEEILAATPEQFGADLESLVSPADAEVLTGDLLRWLTKTHQVALSAGDQGWWDDGAAKHF
jgi:hypothetical protein